MSGIRILDELSRELKSDRKTLKVPSNWLDRLRSKKGFPTEDSPDLGTFLSSKANTIPQIPRFDENCPIEPIQLAVQEEAEDGAADGDDHDEGDPQVPRMGGPPGFPIEPIQLAVQEEEEEELDEDEEEEEEEEEEESTITEESVISG